MSARAGFNVPRAPPPNQSTAPPHREFTATRTNTVTNPASPAGILHTIFFLRFFSTVHPQTRDVLGLELAYVPEAEIETLVDQRVAALVRQLEAERHQPHTLPDNRGGMGLGLLGGGTPPSSGGGGGGGGGGRGQITIQFLEKRRRKTWYAMRGDDEVCWESWTVKVTVADPRTEGGM